MRNELKAQTIPEEIYSSPIKLLDYTFGTHFFDSLLEGTLNYISDHPQYSKSPYKPDITYLRAYFGYLITLHSWKPKVYDYQSFLSRAPGILKPLMEGDPKCPINVPDSLVHMSYQKFDFLSRVLDLGQNTKVQKLDDKGRPKLRPDGQPIRIYDLRAKFGPFELQSNQLFRKFKIPEGQELTIDETLRASFSPLDMLKTYMPNKSPPYGEKSFSIVDKDLYCFANTTALPGQHSYWTNGVEGMVKFCFPEEYTNRGYSLCGDNYFFTMNLVEYYAKLHTSITATMRKPRVGMTWENKSEFKAKCTKQKPADFQRKIDI